MGVLCDGGFGGCEILFGSERDLLTEMEVRVIGAALLLWLILVVRPLCLISANMEGLFGYTCCARLVFLQYLSLFRSGRYFFPPNCDKKKGSFLGASVSGRV